MASRAAAPARSLFRTWYDPAAIPIWVTVGVACAGSVWYLGRLATGTDIVWDRHNNMEPYNRTQPGTNSKLFSINKEFFQPKVSGPAQHSTWETTLAHKESLAAKEL